MATTAAIATAATTVAGYITANFTANFTVCNVTTNLVTNFTACNVTANVTGTNDTVSNYQQDSELFKVPALLVVVLSVLYGSISVIAVAGNGLVIWAIVTSKRMRSVTNHYLANLAFADILIALFAIPFEVSTHECF